MLRPVLTEVHRHLRLPFSPATVGSIRQEAPDLSSDRLEGSVVAAYGDRFELVPGELDAGVLGEASARFDDHAR